jgi:sugar O-acyltransferase (sialic acid O-acetyltransferase NeuD family)
MKKKLLIIGAGGLGREVFSYLHQHLAGDLTLAGFLDDALDSLHGFDLPVGVLGRLDDYQPKPDEVLLPAIGNSSVKLAVCRSLTERGAKFVNFVHPTAIVGHATRLGTGIFVFPGAIVGPWATIGDFVSIGGNATVGHDAKIGAGCTLSGHTEINGGTQLGEAVFMGSHATVLPRVKIGDHCVLGAGSVTVSSVKPHTTMFGVPAKRLVIGIQAPH